MNRDIEQIGQFRFCEYWWQGVRYYHPLALKSFLDYF